MLVNTHITTTICQNGFEANRDLGRGLQEWGQSAKDFGLSLLPTIMSHPFGAPFPLLKFKMGEERTLASITNGLANMGLPVFAHVCDVICMKFLWDKNFDGRTVLECWATRFASQTLWTSSL